MNSKNFLALTTVLLAATLHCGIAVAEQHAMEALEQAKEAAAAAGDSKAVAEHATEALKNIQASKRAVATNPAAFKHLREAEADLKSAVENANRYNTNAAVQDARDAKIHLDATIQQLGIPPAATPKQ